MPQLTIRGIDPMKLAAVSLELAAELAVLCECGTENFTFDCLPVTSFAEGIAVPTFPFIEVAWFDRGPAVRDRFAEALTRRIRDIGISELEIAFKVYSQDAYYCNGEPCA
jgi:hypothetical protein